MNQLIFFPYNFLSSLYNVQKLALQIEGEDRGYSKSNIQVPEFSEKLKKIKLMIDYKCLLATSSLKHPGILKKKKRTFLNICACYQPRVEIKIK